MGGFNATAGATALRELGGGLDLIPACHGHVEATTNYSPWVGLSNQGRGHCNVSTLYLQMAFGLHMGHALVMPAYLSWTLFTNTSVQEFFVSSVPWLGLQGCVGKCALLTETATSLGGSQLCARCRACAPHRFPRCAFDTFF